MIVVPDEKCNTGNGNRKLDGNNNYIGHNDKALKIMNNLEKGGGVVFTTDRPLELI